jgi:hypothetical protein
MAFNDKRNQQNKSEWKNKCLFQHLEKAEILLFFNKKVLVGWIAILTNFSF